MNIGQCGPAYQKGVSKLGLLILGMFIAVFLTVGLKVGPLYLDNDVLADLADEMVESGSADDMSGDEILIRFANTIRLNTITGFDLDDIKIFRNGGDTTISIAYERRVPIIGNLDIIAAFDHTAE
jgi:hypothetical protein